MKKILSIFLLLFVTIISAQEVKYLNLEDAVLGYYKGLYPQQKSLQWMEGTDDYIVTEGNIVQVNYNLSKRPALFSLEDLQKVIPSLKRMPYSFEKVTSEEVYFQHENELTIYNYKTKTVSDNIEFPTEAENNEYSSDANAVAYTIENNLYVATSSNPKIAVTNISDKNIVSGQAIARSEMGITKGTFW
ncbi:MAG: DPP IV N-terminal domain-containing protein, partial [Flavobacteriaceae bacterium]